MDSKSLQWPEKRVTDWYKFYEALEPALSAFRLPATYLFRGQADASYSLKPSLLRRLSDIRDRSFAREIEEFLEKEFVGQAHLFPETRYVWSQIDQAESKVHVWEFMQHYSCPTRLIDWSSSAFVAAYFAVNELPNQDGALFIVAPEAVHQYYREKDPHLADMKDDVLLDPTSVDCVGFTWPSVVPMRAVSQQGQFSFNTNILTEHDGPILEACRAMEKEKLGHFVHSKIIIPADLKPTILQQLLTMNITARSLFQNLDGTGKSLADIVTLKATEYKDKRS